MFTQPEAVVLIVVGLIGHVMALFWFSAEKCRLTPGHKTIYDVALPAGQIRRELLNSIHAPIHAVLLGVALALGCFQGTSLVSFAVSLLITAAWAEIWHYVSHRVMHWRPLHWIHREHHKSHLNSPFTAISFSFLEKLIFDVGIICVLAAVDNLWSLNFFGVASWYIGYLVINSFSHANFELKSNAFLRTLGKHLTSTTYHSLHHSRYIRNYGLGTRFLDRLFGTEWTDYEDVFEQVTAEQRPLRKLGEKLGSARTRIEDGDSGQERAGRLEAGIAVQVGRATSR